MGTIKNFRQCLPAWFIIFTIIIIIIIMITIIIIIIIIIIVIFLIRWPFSGGNSDIVTELFLFHLVSCIIIVCVMFVLCLI